MRALDLVPFYLADRKNLLQSLSERLIQAFGEEVRSRTPWFDPELCFDRSRGQYNSTQLLRHLLADPEPGAERILAVTSVDLFIPVLTFVFGEAQVGGRAAVVSLHRLRAEAYGLPADEPLLAERLAKEAIHELGHTRGLLHCPDLDCVMHASTYVEEIDLKPASFCRTCRGTIRGAV
jgi:archaemetzincin